MTEVVPEGIQLDPISRELWHIVKRRQQLLSRRTILLEMQEFLKNSRLSEVVAEEEKEEDESELERVENELQSLSEKEKEVTNRMWEKQVILQEATQDSSVTECDCVTFERKKDLRIISGVYVLPSATARQSLITEQAASSDKELTSTGPAPESSEDIVDVQDLSRSAATVHCPTCKQKVTTEIHYKAGKSSFLLCFFSLSLCCVAGCCLLPFFLDYFKDTIHRCPSCHTEIHTVHRL